MKVRFENFLREKCEACGKPAKWRCDKKDDVNCYLSQPCVFHYYCDKCKRMISPGEPVRNHLLEDYCERCYKMADTGDMLLDDVYLTPRSSNVARLANIRTIKELAGKTMREMLRIKNCGRKSLDEFQELLRQYDLNFRQET